VHTAARVLAASESQSGWWCPTFDDSGWTRTESGAARDEACVGEVDAAWPEGRDLFVRAHFDVPRCCGSAEASVALRLDATTVEVSVNGTPLPPPPAGGCELEATVRLPEQILVPGQNVLALRLSEVSGARAAYRHRILVDVAECRAARPPEAPAARSTEPPTQAACAKAAERYRALRAGRGATPTSTRVLDAWGGPLHGALQTLAACWGTEGLSAKALDTAMGEPDRVVHPGDPLWGLAENDGADALFVYEWRGLHDFLFFAIANDRVLRAGWWMAGE
jgi:hypothetical protein